MSDKQFKDNDINEWPHRWKGMHEDIAYGEMILAIFKPFIEALKQSGQARSTVNRHIDNLWMLGGWLITHINYYPENRSTEPYIHFLKNIAGLDGPLIHDFTESQQNEFDTTCRKFYKWMIAQGYKLPIKPEKKSSARKTKK